MSWGVDSRGDHAAPAGTAFAVRHGAGLLCGGLALAMLLPGLAAAAPTTVGKAVRQKFSSETPLTPFQPSVSDSSTFSFTASGGAAASARLQTVERAFRFTPSGQSDNRKALSLGINTRVTAPSPDRSRAAAPAEAIASAAPRAYNVDLSVGWKGFTVNTGYGQVDPAPNALLASRRDSVDFGVGYRGKNWNTMLQGTAERGGAMPLASSERRYAVEFGGAYSIGPRVSVRGGVRYQIAPVTPSLLDPDRNDQSVYLGTNVAF